jgi:hypothetical protein
MDDPLKKLAERAVNAKHGTPRFDPGQLKYAEINNGYVTFFLRTHAVAVKFDQMTAEEAQLARLYIRKPAGQKHDSEPAYDFDNPDIDDAMIDDVIADFKAHPETYPEIKINDEPPDQHEDEKKRDGDECSDEKKGLLDALFYTTPGYVIKYRIIMSLAVILVVICIAIGFGVVNYIQHLPYNNDKNEAYAIAMKDPALTGYIAGRDVSVETISANYYDPVSRSDITVSSNYIDVELQAWIFTNAIVPGENITFRKPLEIGTFKIIVDLKNDTSSSNGKSVMQWPG